jgi:peptidoglycan/LPS O-acetylase OafA/YrhL
MAGKLATTVVIAGVVLYAISMPAALIGLVLRFRSSRGAERQQLRWVVAGAAAAAAGLVAGANVPQQTVISSILYAMVLCIPLGLAVAVLRYRLWDLDRLVSRTVSYALVTALLVVPYLLILPVTASLARGSGSLAVAAATLIAAAAFQPLRRRVQDLVDRRFNRRRYDTARTLEHFAARLRDQLDLDALEGELLGVVDQTVAPTRASLWLRPPANPPQPPT